MARQKRNPGDGDWPRILTKLGTDTRLEGVLRFRESVEISGTLVGKVVAEGFLYIRESAEITADIKAREIVVGGTVHGNIEATDRLEILATGKIYGNVRTARFRVADGVVFEGRCEMLRDAEAIDVFAVQTDRVRESAPRV